MHLTRFTTMPLLLFYHQNRSGDYLLNLVLLPCILRHSSLLLLQATNHITSGWPILRLLKMSLLSLPYKSTMAGLTPTYTGRSGPIPMRDLTGDGHYNQGYVDPTTNTERLSPRPRERSSLEKTYSGWCCGSIIGVVAWVLAIFLFITVPIVVVALRSIPRQRKPPDTAKAPATGTQISSRTDLLAE